MVRYNIFLQAHKGTRAMLYQTASVLQQTDFTDKEETDNAVPQVQQVLDIASIYAASEDRIILSAIDRYEPGIAALFESEHLQNQVSGDRVRSLVSNFYKANSATEKKSAGDELHQGFIDFLLLNIKHIAKEERILNNFLWKYYSDEELRALAQQLLGEIPPDLFEKYGRWLMVGLNNAEIIYWLKAVKNNAPCFVLENLLSQAADELAPARWEIVKEALLDGALLA